MDNYQELLATVFVVMSVAVVIILVTNLFVHHMKMYKLAIVTNSVSILITSSALVAAVLSKSPIPAIAYFLIAISITFRLIKTIKKVRLEATDKNSN